MESIGDCSSTFEQSWIRYILKFELKQEFCKYSISRQGLDDIRSSVALPRRIEEKRFGPAQAHVWSRDLIDSTSFFYCKTNFLKVKVNPSLDDWWVRYCARQLISSLRVWLLFERVASSVSTGKLQPCAKYATSTPQACNVREACDSIWAMFTIHLERKIRTWRASSNSAMLLLESELESSFAPRYLSKKDEYPFCCSIEGDKYATISAAICLIQLKTLQVTSTTHDEETVWRRAWHSLGMAEPCEIHFEFS